MSIFRRFSWLARRGTLLRLACGVMASALLSACPHDRASGTPPSDADVLAAESLRPARADLAERYERSCLACHGVRSAAPLTGHAPSWQARLEQGPQTLLRHTREGLRGMPAMGLCPDCSDEDLQALIAFMSTGR